MMTEYEPVRNSVLCCRSKHRPMKSLREKYRLFFLVSDQSGDVGRQCTDAKNIVGRQRGVSRACAILLLCYPPRPTDGVNTVLQSGIFNTVSQLDLRQHQLSAVSGRKVRIHRRGGHLQPVPAHDIVDTHPMG